MCSSDLHDSGVLEEGMITTDEPGVYLEGKYGIRTENELVCRKQRRMNMVSLWNLRTSLTHRSIWMESIRSR